MLGRYSLLLALMVILLLSVSTLTAQVNDDFSDGDFTNNPTWSGDVSAWTVINGELRSDGSGTDEISLSTPSSRLAGTEWNFKLRYEGGAPSGGNKFRIYLVSDTADLEADLQGYFVEVGESLSLDSYDLYKQNGSSTTLLIDGQDGLAGNSIDARVKVIRDANGNWQLFVDRSNVGIYLPQGSANDVEFTSSSFFGIQVSHSSTKTEDYFVDDVYVGDPVQDTLPPQLVDLTVRDAQTLSLTFDEALDTLSAENISNYQVDGGLGNPAQATLDPNNPAGVILTLSSSLQSNTNYQLSYSNISDFSGNVIPAGQSQAFTYFVPDEASFKDVIISEIMADPNPPQGLPDAEYLELYNRSNGTYNLRDWTIDNGTTQGLLPDLDLGPGQYLILVSSGDESDFESFGTVAAPSSWTSLVNGGDNLGLRSNTGILIDSVDYESTWYRDGNKDNGGFALEIINPDQLDCAGANNWTASLSTQGGTPGIQNSVFSTAPDQTAPQVISAEVLSSDTLLLCFSEGMNPASLMPLDRYSLSAGIGNPLSVQVEGGSSNCVKLIFMPDIQTGVSYQLEVKEMEDCSGNLLATRTLAVAKGLPPSLGQVVITEVFPDFEPQRSLPLSEFVEIFNRSNTVLDLGGYSLSDGTSEAEFSSATLFPGEYAIVCSILDTADWNDFGKVIPVTALPSLNNSTDSISLLGPFFETIDYVFYSSEWYANANKAAGGWTLERIDNDLIDCNNAGNWTASLDNRGGTPGTENSVKGVFIDNRSPQLESIKVPDDRRLILRFDEPMNPAGLEEESNFVLDQGIGEVLRAIVASPDNQTLLLDLPEANPLQEGRIYQLTLSKLSDCLGNPFDASVRVGLPTAPQAFDLIFTELLPDESPSVGLPEAEYVELYNRSQNNISLGGLTLEISGTETELPDFTLFPGEYVALVDEDDVELFDGIPAVLPVGNLPSLRNAGDSLYLYAGSSLLIDFLAYDEDWYGDPAKSEGGFSLERVDISSANCLNSENWRASEDGQGGTPGRVNSVLGDFEDDRGPILSALRPLNSNELLVEFSEQMDPTFLEDPGFYLIDQQFGSPILATTNPPFYNQVRLLFDKDFLPGSMYELSFNQGLEDCSGNELSDKARFGLPQSIKPGDILINEILFNPITGGSDFVEIVNVSQKVVDLSVLNIGEVDEDNEELVNEDPLTEQITLLLPGQILCLTRDVNFQKNLYLPPASANFLEMDGFPSFDDADGTCVIFTDSGQVIDSFYYEDDYHYLTLDDDDGVSLERLSLSQPTNDPENWQSAASLVGYATPGYENSQFIPESSAESEVFLENTTFSPNLDGQDDVLAINYKLDFPAANLRVQIFDANGRSVRILQQNFLANPDGGRLFWDGFDHNQQRAAIGMYVILVEVLNADTGEKKIYRRVAVLADNF